MRAEQREHDALAPRSPTIARDADRQLMHRRRIASRSSRFLSACSVALSARAGTTRCHRRSSPTLPIGESRPTWTRTPPSLIALRTLVLFRDTAPTEIYANVLHAIKAV